MLDESGVRVFVSVKLDPSAAVTCAAVGHAEVDAVPPLEAPVEVPADDPLVVVLDATVLDELDDEDELLPQAVIATVAPTATTASARCVGLTGPPGSATAGRHTTTARHPLTPNIPLQSQGFSGPTYQNGARA